MLTLRLRLYAYGTVIPDLRTLVYRDADIQDRDAMQSEELYRLDRLLSTSGSETPISTEDDLLDRFYHKLQTDKELLLLIEEVHTAGGETTLLTPAYLKTRSTYAETLRSFLSAAPEYIQVSPLQDGALSSPFDHNTIVVARQIESIEAAMARGDQAIHYESASRLRRELELRGYRIKRRHPAVQ